MGRLPTPDRLAQDPHDAILTIRGAWSSLAAVSLTPHALAPVAKLPVLEIVSSVHMVRDLTLGLGKVVHDYLR
jgi:acetoacetate decarboxylase